MKRYLSILLFLVGSYSAIAQTATISGRVKEQGVGALTGANVFVNYTNATQTDDNGYYSLQVEPGEYQLICTYTGYASDTQTIILKPGEKKTLNITLSTTSKMISEVTVSVGRVNKKITQEAVSIEVFKPRILEANNITNVQQALNKVPGVTILDGSVSIRGGSGYAYGSGSRVMMVVDEMPLITPDRGEIRWEFVPMENVKQIEVLKGASSVQYGSSALNGVISVTTDNPTDTPLTKITYYTDVYDNPSPKSYKWWGGDSVSYLRGPHTNGITMMHSRKFGNDVNFTLGMNLHESKSHLKDEYDNRMRVNMKLKYLPHKIKNLTFGLSANILLRKQAFQFFWQDDTRPYLASPGVTISESFLYSMIDPSIYYTDKSNTHHRLLSRWYNQMNPWDKNSPKFSQFNVDYQLRHDFGNYLKVIAGFNNIYFKVVDGVLGTHTGNQGGLYFQAEGYYKGLTLSFGTRFEYLNLDNETRLIMPKYLVGKKERPFYFPVSKFGINYKFRKYNFLRFHIGQGFRFGSIAERFVDYSLDILHIIPNPTLVPEDGYSMEIGYKRQVNIKDKWRMYLDGCFFWQEFRNMIEFQMVGIQAKPLPATGIEALFKSMNVTKARIFGWELNAMGEGKIGKNLDLSFQGGYTYFYPRDMSDTAYSNKLSTFFNDAFRTAFRTDSADRTHMLKYRQRHQFKFDVDAIVYKNYRLGASVLVYSYMDGVDPVFEAFIKGVQNYRRATLNKPDWALDLRTGYKINKHFDINFIIRNVTNNYYAIRIAKPNAPRTFTIQLNARF